MVAAIQDKKNCRILKAYATALYLNPHKYDTEIIMLREVAVCDTIRGIGTGGACCHNPFESLPARLVPHPAISMHNTDYSLTIRKQPMDAQTTQGAGIAQMLLRFKTLLGRILRARWRYCLAVRSPVYRAFIITAMTGSVCQTTGQVESDMALFALYQRNDCAA